MNLYRRYSRTGPVLFLTLLLTACSAGGTHDIGAAGGSMSTGTSQTATELPPPAGATVPSFTEEGATQEPKDAGGSAAAGDPVMAEFCTGQYFKAGDFGFQLDLSYGGWEERDSLSFVFSGRDQAGLERSRQQTVLSEYLLPRGFGTGSFQAKNRLEDSGAKEERRTATLTLNGDGTVTLSDGTAASGDYYPYVGQLRMPDAFLRPLNSTDLTGLTKNDMRLIRNEFYAVYGRAFSDKNLRAYFDGMPWYRETTAADQFPEGILGGLYKRNIAFLKTAEDAYDETQAASAKAAYDSLSPAPYSGLLPESGEILVTFPSGPEQVSDKGIYYVVPGAIFVPITLTPDQYEHLDAGETVSLEINGITGETQTLKKAADPSYGTYVFGEESGGHYVMANYHPETGLFTLWHDSEDTDFKLVYEGDLYILKGAMEEYCGYFDLPPTKQNRTGGYRYIDFRTPDPDGYSPYNGNILIRDPKGYIKALYFMGD